MNTIQVKTPALIKSEAAIDEALLGLRTGAMPERSVALMLNAAGRYQTLISVETKARIAAPRILSQEAKQIEHEEIAQRIPSAGAARERPAPLESTKSDASTARPAEDEAPTLPPTGASRHRSKIG